MKALVFRCVLSTLNMLDLYTFILVYLYMCIVMLGLHCPATSEKRCPWYMNVSLAIQEMTVRLPVFVD